jgi:hypothetical protein
MRFLLKGVLKSLSIEEIAIVTVTVFSADIVSLLKH